MFTINKTFSIKKNEIQKEWWVIDASDLVLGRLASRIAIMLKGKHKPSYTPHMDCGDNVIVVNADKIFLTGSKLKNKLYYKHTGYPGGIKSQTPVNFFQKGQADKVLRMAVKRMLGKSPLRYRQISNLYVYSGSEHKQAAQQPKVCDISILNKKNSKKRGQ